MRAVIQRINGAEITINGGETRKVGEGLVVFICAMEGDTDAQADFLVQKVCGLRVFKDENDKMNPAHSKTSRAIFSLSRTSR